MCLTIDLGLADLGWLSYFVLDLFHVSHPLGANRQWGREIRMLWAEVQKEGSHLKPHIS